MGTISKVSGRRTSDISKVNGISPTLDLSSTVSPIPSVSLAGGTFGVVTATVTKDGGGTYTNPNYSAVATLADGTVTVTDANIDRNLESDLSHLSGVLNFTDTNTSTAQRTLTVQIQEFGTTTRSATTTATYTPSFAQNKFLRIQGCDADGTNNNTRLAFRNIKFFSGAGQSGTEYPTTDLTANDSETGITISAGAFFNATYADYKAFDSSVDTWWWTLGNSTADNNWIQIEFEDGTYGTKPIIKSIVLNKHFDTNIASYVKITGSDNADHSSATSYGVYLIPEKTGNGDVSEFNIG